MKRFNIVEINKEDFVLASCPTMEIANERLLDMYKTDRELAKYYGWTKLPLYKIVESEE